MAGPKKNVRGNIGEGKGDTYWFRLASRLLQPGGLEVIAYHGTNKKAAESIQRTGFMAGTWFARDKKDALTFGGPYIFSVKFSDDLEHWRGQSDGKIWQFWLRDSIGPEKIVGLDTPTKEKYGLSIKQWGELLQAICICNLSEEDKKQLNVVIFAIEKELQNID